MKKLQILLFIASCILIQFNVAAQQRFIEVTVTDSVKLRSTSYVYEISFGENTEFFGINIPSDSKDTVSDSKVTELTSMLDQNKFKYQFTTSDEYSVNKKNPTPKVEVYLQNESELKALHALLMDKKDMLSGKIRYATYEPIEAQNLETSKRLYASALRQAKEMAQIMGGSVGSVISVSEATQPFGDLIDVYTTFFKSMPTSFFNLPYENTRTEVVERVFKFELK